LLQDAELVLLALQHLANQVFREIQIVARHGEHG
jgi:hypothetical protein